MDNRKNDKVSPGNKKHQRKNRTPVVRVEFNTDGNMKGRTKKVGPGYDDTGKGNDAHASRSDEKKARQR